MLPNTHAQLFACSEGVNCNVHSKLKLYFHEPHINPLTRYFRLFTQKGRIKSASRLTQAYNLDFKRTPEKLKDHTQ